MHQNIHSSSCVTQPLKSPLGYHNCKSLARGDNVTDSTVTLPFLRVSKACVALCQHPVMMTAEPLPQAQKKVHFDLKTL